MTQLARRPATYADLESVPPHLVAEILFGDLVTHPRPVARHSVSSSALTGELNGPFQKGVGGPGGWIFMDEPELHLGPHVVVPDLAGWQRDRLPVLPETTGIDTAPDWLAEFLSPSTERDDRGRKRAIYATYGVKHLWYINPRSQVLEVFELKGGQWVLAAVLTGNDQVSAPPFEAISFALGLLWPYDPTSSV